jgi:hypothetical protein
LKPWKTKPSFLSRIAAQRLNVERAHLVSLGDVANDDRMRGHRFSV